MSVTATRTITDRIRIMRLSRLQHINLSMT
jgi:hypothetical protein